MGRGRGGYGPLMDLTTVLTFLAVAGLAYVTPGPDWFVVMHHAMRSRRDGVLAAVGVQCGLLVHLTAAAVGVAAILLASATAFTVLKVVGGLYLVWLGVRAWRDGVARWRTVRAEVAQEDPEPSPGAVRVVATSFLANVLNPKAALFFVAVLPQFVSAGAPVAPQVVVLGLIDVVLGLAWWGLFVAGVVAIGAVLRGRRARAAVDLVSGTALVGLGSAVALTARRT